MNEVFDGSEFPRLSGMSLFSGGIKSFFSYVFHKAPVLGIYYLTHRCNSRCTYCDIPTADYHKTEFENPPEKIAKNLQDLARLGVRYIDFTGGEPLLYESLPDVLRFAKKQGIFTIITTNGLLFRKRAHELIGLVDDLKISLSTTDPDLYRYERGVDGYQEVIRAICHAIDYGFKPTILPTITEYNIDGIQALIQLAQEFNVLLMLRPEFGYFPKNRSLPAELTKRIRQWIREANAWTNEACLQAHIEGGNQIHKPRCRSATAAIVISPDNKLVLPGFYCKKIQIPIGENLYDLYHSEEVQEIRRKEGTWDYCQGCRFYGNYESGFLWPMDRYFVLNTVSRLKWLYLRRTLKPRIPEYLNL
jgi:MoaA/NifB/PqqE/SkfB family radical SAM enzyme